jgi:enediyne biosynthesis protein E3
LTPEGKKRKLIHKLRVEGEDACPLLIRCLGVASFVADPVTFGGWPGQQITTGGLVTFVLRARRGVLGISLEEACLAKRGFQVTSRQSAERLERVGGEFLAGYHAALEESDAGSLAARLNTHVALEYRGFAFEGAAMGLSLLDRLRLSSGSFASFLAGAGSAHVYMLHVGAGWAVARLPWLRLRLPHVLASFDPLLRWLVVDGYGFHEGYFHWPAAIGSQRIPRGLSGYAARAFDQGLGRSLWFVEGIDSERVARSIAQFPESRRCDLWAGVGLACAYAGGADSAGLACLTGLAGQYAAAAAQGSAFAAEARRLAGNPVRHCEEACRALAGVSADEAAALARETMKDLPPDGPLPAYEIWRTRIQRHFAAAPHGVSG